MNWFFSFLLQSSSVSHRATTVNGRRRKRINRFSNSSFQSRLEILLPTDFFTSSWWSHLGCWGRRRSPIVNWPRKISSPRLMMVWRKEGKDWKRKSSFFPLHTHEWASSFALCWLVVNGINCIRGKTPFLPPHRFLGKWCGRVNLWSMGRFEWLEYSKSSRHIRFSRERSQRIFSPFIRFDNEANERTSYRADEHIMWKWREEKYLVVVVVIIKQPQNDPPIIGGKLEGTKLSNSQSKQKKKKDIFWRRHKTSTFYGCCLWKKTT